MNFRSFLFSLFFVAGFVLVLSSCQKDTYVSDEERRAAESQLYLKFLSENFDLYSDSSVVDTLVGSMGDSLVKRVFGNKDSVDLVYWEKEKGIGDTITSGQKVGYRYKLYSIANNDSSGVVDKLLVVNSFNNLNPDVATIDARSSSTGYLLNYVGLNEGLQHMRLNGKAWMFMPSSQTSNDYYSRFYEIEVVYVGR